MAIYKQLALSHGGGIIAPQQQAEQVENTATILIGLGGTGIDCLRNIKTQVYHRLKPDDPDAIVKAYKHIRFVGIDSDGISMRAFTTESDDSSLIALDDTEFFSIADGNLASSIKNERAMTARRDTNWLRWEDIEIPDFGKDGAGGIRQIGRFMMMNKSNLFRAKISEVINGAKRDLNTPKVNIHIFSGLSGGTGSGCFLDVCYMIKDIVSRIGGGTIFGYFFLPDVNLSRIPMSATHVREYIPINGYCSMQELDYCMQLQFNGGAFTQEYQNHKIIAWKEAPVDLCHLICATDENDNVISNAYNYAMNVTAEYVMDFLTKPEKESEFDLSEHLANFRQMVSEADSRKEIGSTLSYCVIGASCATIPLREINTYLATEVFSKFAGLKKNIPSKEDVEELAVNALADGNGNVTTIYENLMRELEENADSSYVAYPYDWKTVRDYGNRDLVANYTDQTASKLNATEANAKSMITEKNSRSLIARIRSALTIILKDINRGPIYAYGMLNPSVENNLLYLIDGLIRENTERMRQEAAQTELRQSDYDNARTNFENRVKRSLFDNDQKRYQDYEFYLMVLSQHNLYMGQYLEMAKVLDEFRKQVEEGTAGYYAKLARVMDTLIETFRENRDALASMKLLKGIDSFAIPMMTIEELKPSLDAEIEKINIPNLLDSFMLLLVNNDSQWRTEDENTITKLVTDFFVKTAFESFASRTITNFLKDKYHEENDDRLAKRIYKDWMRQLTAKASPLFYFNGTIWRQDQITKLAFLSYPDASNPIKMAAGMMEMSDPLWKPKASALTERIYAMCVGVALPLSAYANCEQYEKVAFATTGAGRHYYEGKPMPGMPFNDWRNLPSLTPASRLRMQYTPEKMRNMVSDAVELFKQAQDVGIFGDWSEILRPSQKGIQDLQELVAETNELIDYGLGRVDSEKVIELEEKLKNAREIPMVSTGKAMKDDGFHKESTTIISVRCDHFVQAPVYQMLVKDVLAEIEGLQPFKVEADRLIATLNSWIYPNAEEKELVNTEQLSSETINEVDSDVPLESSQKEKQALDYELVYADQKEELNVKVANALKDSYSQALEVLDAIHHELSSRLVKDYYPYLFKQSEAGNFIPYFDEGTREFFRYLYLLDHSEIESLPVVLPLEIQNTEPTLVETSAIETEKNTNTSDVTPIDSKQNLQEEPVKDVVTKETGTNQKLSERLEEATVLVLKAFVKWLQEEPQQSLYHVTVEDEPDRQSTGTQYGYDVDLNLFRNDVHFRIGFECKAYKEREGKVLNSDAYAHNFLSYYMYSNHSINNRWILISPFGYLQNDYQKDLFDFWNDNHPSMQAYAFTEKKTKGMSCEEFLSLNQDAFESVYENRTYTRPSQEEYNARFQTLYDLLVGNDNTEESFKDRFFQFSFGEKYYEYAHNHNLMMILHDKDAQRAENAVWEAIQRPDREGIYVIGEYGTGKTWLTYKLIETVLRYPDKYPYNPIWGSLRNNKLSEIDQAPMEQMDGRDKIKIRNMIKAKAEDFVASMEQIRDYRKKQLQPLYILDGFDEVMSGLSYTDNKIDFLMQVVTTIQEKHRRDAKKPKIIITSRESDYAVCKNHTKFESASVRFDKIYLIDCEKEEARRCILEFASLYKEENQEKKGELETLAHNDTFVQLMTRPVFLSFLRELVLQQYEPKMYLKPFDILEDVVDQTCYNESDETEKQLRELLSKYAIAMSRENKNWYALEDDLKNLLREDAIGIVRLNTVNEQQRISFAHNIIREYLVAQQLFTCQQKEMQPETGRVEKTSDKSDFYTYIDTLDLSAATQQLLLQNMHRKEGDWAENLDFLLGGIQETTKNRNAERATRLLSLLLQPKEQLIGKDAEKINLHDVQIRDLSIRNCILKHINMQNVHINKLQIVDSTLEDIDFRDAQIDSIYVGSDEKLKDASYRRKGVNSFYLYSLNQKGRVTEYAIADLENPKEDSTITIWEEPMETLEKLTTVDENCFPYTAEAIYQYHTATRTMSTPYQMGAEHRIYEIGKGPLSLETNYIVYREEERWQIFMYNKTTCVLRTLPDELNFALSVTEDGKINGKITVLGYDRILCQVDSWMYYIDKGKMIPLPEGLPLEKTYAVCQINGNMIFSYLSDKEFYQILLAKDRPAILSIPYTLQGDVISQCSKLQYLTDHDLLAMGENKLYLLRIRNNDHMVQVTALQTQVICRNLILENPDGSHRLGNEEAYRALHG